ncbi:hypothetical protein A9R01_09710 ['Osedax' symbiont bacterium Rs2_46_30_T18]|nr:hypothetical protein A9R01_09710 ['Osedax' symbiont bacterium Rs2_46_30_T18]
MFSDANKNNQLKTEIIDTIIGYDDRAKNKNRQLLSKRILVARRAIEKHHEKKELNENLDDYWPGLEAE